MILVGIFYHILPFLKYSMLFIEFKLGDEILDLLGMETNFSGCRSDGDFILDDGH